MEKNQLLDNLFDKMLIVSKNMLTSLEKEADKLGYNRTEYLIILDVITNQHTTAQHISERTGIKKSALSRSLNPLIDKGIISKIQCVSDRRESRLTVDNAEVLEQFCKTTLLNNMFTRCPESPQDLEDINTHLDKLLSIMEQPK